MEDDGPVPKVFQSRHAAVTAAFTWSIDQVSGQNVPVLVAPPMVTSALQTVGQRRSVSTFAFVMPFPLRDHQAEAVQAVDRRAVELALHHVLVETAGDIGCAGLHLVPGRQVLLPGHGAPHPPPPSAGRTPAPLLDAPQQPSAPGTTGARPAAARSTRAPPHARKALLRQRHRLVGRQRPPARPRRMPGHARGLPPRPRSDEDGFRPAPALATSRPPPPLLRLRPHAADEATMTVHFNDLAPGIAIECDDENFTLAAYAQRAIFRLAGTPLGRRFLAEFAPDRWPDDRKWPADPYRHATVLITQPSGEKPKFGSSEAAKLAVAETKIAGRKEGKTLQRIVSWWPGSENSRLGQGIKFLHDTFPAPDPDRSATDKRYVEPGEFIYHDSREKFEIVLIHELIHAYHGLKGTFANETGDTPTVQAKEERCVVGIYEFKEETYTENKFRFLFGWPPRDDYKSLKIKPDVTLAKAWEVWCTHGGRF
jgi:hypothetical protein